MKNFKKILLMGVSYVLIAALAIGGTLAYLQDSDEAVNVMTLGNVYIEQIEQERDANGKLVPFTQAKPAYPAVGEIAWANNGVVVNGAEYKLFTPELKNVVDKIVTINNVGKTDAFVRTIVAIEAPDYDPQDLIHINFNEVGVTISAPLTTEINGVKYVIFTFTYTEALAAGAKSAPSLIQLFLDKRADNEFCAKFGTAWEVLTLSQGVQAAGFADAQTALNAGFGEVNAANAAKWFGDELDIPALVDDADELIDALGNGEDVILSDDVMIANNKTGTNGYGATGISVLDGQTIDGAGNSVGVNAWGTWDTAINITSGTIKNITVNSGMRGIFISHNGDAGKVYLENVIIDGTIYTISCDQGTNSGLEAKNSVFNGWTSYAATIGDVKFVDCSFGEGQGYAFCRPYAPTAFVGCDFEAGYEIDARAAVTFENCTINGVALTAENLSTLVTSNIANATVVK